ncbi:MAG: polymerase [Chloroflexota bacterium]|nr:polymerase [Chloroflexota bacterium]
MARKILHLDLDAFFCAVEEKFDPSLKGQAFATGGSPDGRGVVTSASYAARKHGIHSAQPMKQALRKFPQLKLVRSHYHDYVDLSRQVMDIIHQLTPLVEQISIDEAFMDVTDLPESGEEIARKLQKKISDELGLPCSIGIASNKLMAKIATNQGKARHKGDNAPMAILFIPPGEEEAFLAELPIGEMWGIGPKSAARFEAVGIHTIGDILKQPLPWLEQNFGKFAHDLVDRARGIDTRPVADYDEVKSVSNEVTFFDDLGDQQLLLRTLRTLSQKVGGRLRKKGLAGKTVRIKLRWPNFETITRQVTLDQPTNQDSLIFETAQELFLGEWKPGKKIRLIGVGVAQICTVYQQLSLLDDSYEKEKNLLQALDDLHARFGKDAIQQGIQSDDYRSWKDS